MLSTWFWLCFVWKDWFCDSTSIDGFEMILHCRFWLLIESLVEILVHCFTTTTIFVAATPALFLPYHLFIDSRLSKSITIFLVKKTNGINENKESNNSYWQSMIHPFMNVWMIINGINKNQCVYCDIGCCRIGEKDGMMIHVRW